MITVHQNGFAAQRFTVTHPNSNPLRVPRQRSKKQIRPSGWQWLYHLQNCPSHVYPSTMNPIRIPFLSQKIPFGSHLKSHSMGKNGIFWNMNRIFTNFSIFEPKRPPKRQKSSSHHPANPLNHQPRPCHNSWRFLGNAQLSRA